MACFKQWLYVTSAVAAYAAGVTAMIGSGVLEAGSLGAATPAAAAAFVGGALAALSALAAYMATLIDLAECYEQNGKLEEAAKVRAKVAALQDEHDRLQALVDRVRSAVGV
jgi:hypothetical protein